MRCVAICHNASMHIRGRILTERTGTDEKRIRVGRAKDYMGQKKNGSAAVHGANTGGRCRRVWVVSVVLFAWSVL